MKIVKSGHKSKASYHHGRPPRRRQGFLKISTVALGFMKDISPTLLNDPVFQRVLKDGLEIQDRFSAEPKYAQTGKGFLKSAGVDELRAIKEKKASEETQQFQDFCQSLDPSIFRDVPPS